MSGELKNWAHAGLAERHETHLQTHDAPHLAAVYADPGPSRSTIELLGANSHPDAHSSAPPHPEPPMKHETPDHTAKTVVPDADTIDQVRELLFGDHKRSGERSDKELHKRIDDFVAATEARFSEVERRISDVAREAMHSQASAIDEIGEAISQLGATVRRMSGARKV